jgi:Xaa-Pro aminopeptidase
VTVDDWSAGATIGGRPVPGQPDLERMRRERTARLQVQLEAEGLDGLVLLGSSANAYASGALAPGEDSGRAGLFRSVTVVVRGAPAPHLFTPFSDGAPPELPADHLHGPLFPDLEDGIAEFASALGDLFGGGARLGVDEQTHPMLRSLGRYEWTDAAAVVAPAKIAKTVDEVACIRHAQHISELAMLEAQAVLRPGVRQSELSGAFLRRVFELGATSGAIDPIWQVMAPTKDAGPWTIHGDIAYPAATTDRFLREGDVIWVDAGINYNGYASDYGRTWITSNHPRPTPRQAAQFDRWRAVNGAVLELLKPGVTAIELTRAAIAANDGVKPWIEHFYLSHAIGTDSAELPLIGTDLGDEFDERQVMAPGMVLVLEPVIWEEGAAGYRSEDIVVVTDDGWLALSGDRYDPFTVAA